MQQISASLDGELTPEEEQALQAHLEECQDCRTAMALLRSMTKVMREDTVQPPEKLAEGTRYLFEREKKNRGFSLKRWRFTAIAAVICLALLGVVKLAPWNAGKTAEAAPMSMQDVTAAEENKISAAASKEMLTAMGSADGAPGEPEVQAEVPAPKETPEEEMRGAPVPAATSCANEPAADDRGSADGIPESGQSNTATFGAPRYSAEALPGYGIYSQLEGAGSYYSVCFCYGPVPESIRTNRECTPLDAPEGQERWLVPHSVCVNEGLLEQFNEVYYGDLLSQQGLVIGILDMEEDQWQP